MSAARALLLLIFGFTMLKFICCYSDGSLLTDQCQSMAIDHGVQASGQDSNPFTVIPDNVTVNSSQVGTGITVTLSTSSVPFLGYMLEARECDNCPPAGTFSGIDSANSLLLCGDQAVAHPNNNDKTSVLVTWTPQATGQFYFRAAFVQTFSFGWQKKAIILPTTTTLPPTTPMTTSPLATTQLMTQSIMHTMTPTTTQTMTQTTTQTMTQTTMQTTTQKTTSTPTTTPTTVQMMMMTTTTTTTTDTPATVTTRHTTIDTSTAPPTSAVNSTQTGLTVFTTPNLQATVNTTQTDPTTNTTLTSNTQSQTTVTPSYLLQCVRYMRGGVVLLLFSRLCFLGGSSLLMIIKPVSKMPTQIASIIELISKIITTILVLIKAVHYDCENAGLQFVFAALIVTAMITSLMHTITVFLHRGLSHELKTCWIGSLIIVDLLNTLITSISIFYGLWWFQGRWMLIVMTVYVTLEFILYLGAAVFKRMEKYKKYFIKRSTKRVEQNCTVLENKKPPWFLMFVICLVFYVMFTVALIVGVSLLCFQAGSSCMLLN
nr:uncharacterized protein LOC108179094 isoform X4 [Danio rerio]|eukprot:XP_021327714.1 uncharacterized protein LOC108179094 isoform X4 [Danio rerio]